MFFILSKVLLFVLQPFYWIVVAMILAIIIKSPRWKKRLWIAAIVVFVLSSNFWLYKTCVQAWQPKDVYVNHHNTYTVGLVLNGMTLSNKNGKSFFGSNADRFIQVYHLYKTGVVKKIYISGGDGSLTQDKNFEANFLEQELKALGVPDSALIKENQSRNTYESAVLAKHYLDSLHIRDTIVLVTSAVHMPRSLACFAKQNIPTVAHSADFKIVNSPMRWDDYCVPNIHTLAAWKDFLKEVVGYYVYKWTNKAT